MPSTTSSSKWAREFYAAVLDVNARLPAERKLRVLIGDPPIALVIYGDDHFQGRGFPANSITNLVERAGFK